MLMKLNINMKWRLRMETYSELNPGKFFKAEDVKGKRLVLTVDKVTIEAMEDKKRKHVAHFKGCDQMLVLNKTRYMALEEIAGSPKPEKWKGAKVVLFAGKTTYAGKSTDSIVVEAPNGTDKEEEEEGYAA
jgi:hypothetical protein